MQSKACPECGNLFYAKKGSSFSRKKYCAYTCRLRRAHRAWKKTPGGRRYLERKYLMLPSTAPNSIVKSIRLLAELQLEMKN